MIQANIDFTSARAAGDYAGNLAADRAEKTDPEFRARALDFIVGYIRQQGEATGESARPMSTTSQPADSRPTVRACLIDSE